MKSLLNIVRSMKTMAILMLIFAFAIGYATFIENDYGTVTAQAEVFKARWFEVLLILLGINLFLNMLNFKMYKKSKALVFMFHASFFIILFGAAVTRYVGFEGTMHIREGQTQNKMISAEPFLQFEISKGADKEVFEQEHLFSKYSKNSFDTTLTLGSENVKFELLEYLPNAAYSIVEDKNGKPFVDLMVTGNGAAQSIQLELGDVYENAEIVLDFQSGKEFTGKEVISIYVKDDQLYMGHAKTIKYLKMDDQTTGELPANDEEPLVNRTLFTEMNTNFVMRTFYKNARKTLVAHTLDSPMGGGNDAYYFQVSSSVGTQNAYIFGSKGSIGEANVFMLGDLKVSIAYGAKMLTVPFSIKLEDFQLDRYPGSMSPSSYASEVTLIDKEEGINMPYRIFMNNILEHRGYRFFQSSYDQDERGTILSVNNDPGTLPTYIGYALLAIGMFGALFMSNGRYRKLNDLAKKSSTRSALSTLLVALVLMMGSTQTHAEEVNPIIKTIKAIDKDHANKFAQLVTQDASGRMKPLDTLTLEIVNKLYRKNSMLGLNANQIVLGMMVRPEAYREIKLIKTSDKEINKILGIPESDKTASFSDFFEAPEEIRGYKIGKYVEEAIRKKPSKRNKLDKALLKVDERVNISYMVYTGSLFKIYPKAEDLGNKWSDTVEALQTFDASQTGKIREVAINYFSAMDEGIASGDFTKADSALERIAEYQREMGAAVYPEQDKLDLEIWQNHANIFERIWPAYFLLGFVLLILSFTKILKPTLNIDWAAKGTFYLTVVLFAAHTLGLAIRWYVSGHAPWSNGYESMIYISWATVLAGFIFSRTSTMSMAATGILAGLILFVAHLNWMDPQITNLVPVLKSYWLSIHVSMITASYGFLALGALLGFIVLILFILKTPNNEKHISLAIKELNAVNEMGLMIGLVMLTVGNFLGGVWANESWGRYWGWDPKETWALVTILVYAVVIHLRFIKAIYSAFSFAAISLLSFTTVLMTYFGVNYYLAGLHSYAKGDPVPVPDFVPWSYAIVFAIIFLAWTKRKLAK